MPDTQPRIAAIGLSEPMLAAIKPLSGTLRTADHIAAYKADYSWTETDVVVVSNIHDYDVIAGPHLLVVGETQLYALFRTPARSVDTSSLVEVHTRNNERDLMVADACPPLYKGTATRLAQELGSRETPPAIISTGRFYNVHHSCLL